MSITTETIKLARSLILKAQSHLLNAIKKEALEIVRRYPMVTKYVQSMGSPTFTVVLRTREFDLDPRGGIGQIAHSMIWSELDASERATLTSLNNSMKKVARLHDCWSDYLSGAAAGEPMCFGKDGKTRTKW